LPLSFSLPIRAALLHNTNLDENLFTTPLSFELIRNFWRNSA